MAFRRRSWRRKKLLFGRRSRLLKKRMHRVRRSSGLKSYGGICR